MWAGRREAGGGEKRTACGRSLNRLQGVRTCLER